MPVAVLYFTENQETKAKMSINLAVRQFISPFLGTGQLNPIFDWFLIAVHGTSFKTDYTLGHKASLNNYKKF